MYFPQSNYNRLSFIRLYMQIVFARQLRLDILTQFTMFKTMKAGKSLSSEGLCPIGEMLGCKCSVQDIMVEGGIPIMAIGHGFFGSRRSLVPLSTWRNLVRSLDYARYELYKRLWGK